MHKSDLPLPIPWSCGRPEWPRPRPARQAHLPARLGPPCCPSNCSAGCSAKYLKRPLWPASNVGLLHAGLWSMPLRHAPSSVLKCFAHVCFVVDKAGARRHSHRDGALAGHSTPARRAVPSAASPGPPPCRSMSGATWPRRTMAPPCGSSSTVLRPPARRSPAPSPPRPGCSASAATASGASTSRGGSTRSGSTTARSRRARSRPTCRRRSPRRESPRRSKRSAAWA